eukprot:TRINITY_DN6334_c0_g1_i1.p1 TRINITY_DN6334_c0_g1~~TRINITY_DN6334_c0_g1_i1.p1  ORF type:complete len:781 (+),score=106.51 TRINITY_DN6334_c0_g1_i1:83-2425(+)
MPWPASEEGLGSPAQHGPSKQASTQSRLPCKLPFQKQIFLGAREMSPPEWRLPFPITTQSVVDNGESTPTNTPSITNGEPISRFDSPRRASSPQPSFRQRMLCLALEFEHLEARCQAVKADTTTMTQLSPVVSAPLRLPEISREDCVGSCHVPPSRPRPPTLFESKFSTRLMRRRGKTAIRSVHQQLASCTDSGDTRRSGQVVQVSDKHDAMVLFFSRIDKAHEEYITDQELFSLLKLKKYFSVASEEVTRLVEEVNAASAERGVEMSHHGAKALSLAGFCRLATCSTLDHSLSPTLIGAAVNVQATLIDLSEDDAIARSTRVSLTDIINPPENNMNWNLVDALVAGIIVANGVVVGLSSDIAWSGFVWAEWLFVSIFFLELMLKLLIIGPRSFFFGRDKSWNVVDLIVVCCGVGDAVVSSISKEEGDLNEPSIVRIFRLARVVRLVRLLRFRCFKEVQLMIQGMAAGLRTLGWAMSLLCIYTFAIGVVLRQTVGKIKSTSSGDDCRDEETCTGSDISFAHVKEHNGSLFGSIPTSMFTVFRCLMDDCSSVDGTPLSVHLHRMYGVSFLLPYWIISIFVSFGFFNLIMAVFVDTVMEAARNKREMREREQCTYLARTLRTFLRKVSLSSSELEECDDRSRSWTDRLWRLLGYTSTEVESTLPLERTSITREQFEDVIMQPQVSSLLDNMDVGGFDRLELFDILDADGSGKLDAVEMISGILQLRGGTDKSRLVALLLRVNVLQTLVMEIAQNIGRYDRVISEEKPSCMSQPARQYTPNGR